jgi:hypothetical protein
MTYDGKSKTAISVRDGFLEYAGHEIGKEPSDKIFKVYRSPATIANVAGMMKGIPLTDDHVDLDEPVTESRGKVTNATMVDFNDESTHSKLAIKNSIDVDDEAGKILQSGKRELSLGYTGVLFEYDGDEYDFEQKDISPHHLAIVDQGRCGSMCSFIDRKTKETEMKNKYHKLFLDAQGTPNMQEIVDMTIALPDAIKAMPIDELKKLAPKLQAIIANAGIGEPKVEEVETETADMDGDETEISDEDEVVKTETTDEGDEVETKDEDETAKDKTAYKDTAQFKDAVAKAVDAQLKEHTDVIVKARDFVDEKYDFKGKGTKQIMRDALAVEHGAQSFADADLAVAFKLLKQSTGKYANFADGDNKTKLDTLKDKEL